MNELANVDALIGKPYSLTRSRLGAVTKLFQEQYICDLAGIKELIETIGQKTSEVGDVKTPEFSFLLSFTDKTHKDGVLTDLESEGVIPTGKTTDRVVLRWTAYRQIEDLEHAISVTVRISNPINPLIYLQAALSKSPNEIDSMEFEMGSTCVTVDGAGQGYADEIFLHISNWIQARRKPHSFLGVGEFYSKRSGLFDFINSSLIPLLLIAALSIYVGSHTTQQAQLTATPIILAAFFVLRSGASALNKKMAKWSAKSQNVSLFELTNGDRDNLARIAARANNSALKLIGSWLFSVSASVAGAVATWWML